MLEVGRGQQHNPAGAGAENAVVDLLNRLAGTREWLADGVPARHPALTTQGGQPFGKLLLCLNDQGQAPDCTGVRIDAGELQASCLKELPITRNLGAAVNADVGTLDLQRAAMPERARSTDGIGMHRR